MKPDMRVLVRVLEEELKLYGALSDCLARQRNALVKLDRPRLEAIVLELEALVSEVGRVSSARAGMVEAAAKELGRPGHSLRDLAEAAPEPYRARFAALRRDLLAQIRSMEGLAGVSRTLIEGSMGQIRAFIRILVGLATPSPVYANPRLTPSALLDRSA